MDTSNTGTLANPTLGGADGVQYLTCTDDGVEEECSEPDHGSDDDHECDEECADPVTIAEGTTYDVVRCNESDAGFMCGGDPLTSATLTVASGTFEVTVDVSGSHSDNLYEIYWTTVVTVATDSPGTLVGNFITDGSGAASGVTVRQPASLTIQEIETDGAAADMSGDDGATGWFVSLGLVSLVPYFCARITVHAHVDYY